MNTEFFEALRLLEKEKGIPADYLLEKINAAIVIAVKRDYGGHDNVEIEVDPDKNKFEVYLKKTVVEEVEDPDTEILLDEARKSSKKAQMGDVVRVKLETKQFGRIAAQTAKHVIRQGIREAERGQIAAEFQSRQQELVTAVVQRIDPKTGAVTVEIGRAEAILMKNEQVPDEELHEGDHVKVYVVEVKETERGPKAIISRTHPGLVKRLFEMEVPEIYDGTVEIKAVSREAGSRTKLAVMSRDDKVDAVGACIGSARSSTSWAARRSTLSSTATTRPSSSPRLFLRQPFWVWKWIRTAPMPVRPRYPTGSFPWPSATRARTPALPPSSPAGRSTSAPKAAFTANNQSGLF